MDNLPIGCRYFPAYHVVRGLGRARGAVVWDVVSSSPDRVTALAFHVSGRVRIAFSRGLCVWPVYPAFCVGGVRRNSVQDGQRDRGFIQQSPGAGFNMLLVVCCAGSPNSANQTDCRFGRVRLVPCSHCCWGRQREGGWGHGQKLRFDRLQ